MNFLSVIDMSALFWDCLRSICVGAWNAIVIFFNALFDLACKAPLFFVFFIFIPSVCSLVKKHS